MTNAKLESETLSPVVSDSSFRFGLSLQLYICTIVDVTAEISLNNGTLIDGKICCRVFFTF